MFLETDHQQSLNLELLNKSEGKYVFGVYELTPQKLAHFRHGTAPLNRGLLAYLIS